LERYLGEFKQHATNLERERDELMRHVQGCYFDELKQHAANLERQRDDLINEIGRISAENTVLEDSLGRIGNKIALFQRLVTSSREQLQVELATALFATEIIWAELSRRVELLENCLLTILGSRSWRITRPLRNSVKLGASLKQKLATNHVSARCSVVVLCQNQWRELARCLQALRKQIEPLGEIVIADCGSTDAVTSEVLDWYHVTGTPVLRNKGRELNRFCESLLLHTHAPLVFVVDANQLVDGSYIQKATQIFDSKPDIQFVNCGLLNAETNVEWIAKSPDRTAVLSASCLPFPIVRRAVFERLASHLGAEVKKGREFNLHLIDAGAKGWIIAECLVHELPAIKSLADFDNGVRPRADAMRAIFEKHVQMVDEYLSEMALEYQDRAVPSSAEFHEIGKHPPAG
jgi:Glycosyl transferase family 2